MTTDEAIRELIDAEQNRPDARLFRDWLNASDEKANEIFPALLRAIKARYKPVRYATLPHFVTRILRESK